MIQAFSHPRHRKVISVAFFIDQKFDPFQPDRSGEPDPRFGKSINRQ